MPTVAEAAQTARRLYRGLQDDEQRQRANRAAQTVNRRSAERDTMRFQPQPDSLTDDPGTGDASRESARAQLEATLSTWGLESLTGQVWDWVRQGLTEVEITQRIRGTQEYGERFKAIALRRERGFSAISEAQVIEYETRRAQILQEAGLPRGFWDSPDDAAEDIGWNVGLPEVSARVIEGYVQVSRADSRVRSAFERFFGPAGDQALAAYFLDRDRALPIIQEQVRMAQLGGTAERFSIQLGRGAAERLAQLGIDQSAAETGFSRIQQLSPLFRETVTERIDLTPEREGIDTVFGTGDTNPDILRKRLEQRVGAFGGGGGPAAGQKGVFGLGVAR